ncbi:flagellar motor protein MotB [Silvibacterium sp.]|uniref:flagellar motor protein MotB n=1 Tax=Silvibacterium sp. TaxID=1964179 RepID=UPI0039E3F97E
MRRRERRHGHVNHERWLVSYADFITLMFAFFVVLYASSQADKRKQAEVSQSINQAFRALGLFQNTSATPKSGLSSAQDESVSPVNVVLGEELAASEDVKHDLTRIQHQLEGKLSNQIAHHVVALKMGRDGLVISLREAGFYTSGSATPNPGSISGLDQIGQTLAATPYDMRIEGHTDNVPIHTGQFASNWELSAARATAMAELFIDRYRIIPGRLSAAGYAEFHPVASNDSEEGRSQNRRVDVIVLSRISVPGANPNTADPSSAGATHETEPPAAK